MKKKDHFEIDKPLAFRRDLTVCALAILFLTISVTEAYAGPSTSISDLQYPTRVVLGTGKCADGIPVTFQVHWTGARKNDLLLIGVLDDQTQDFAEGKSDITGCLSSRGGIVFEKRGRAYCALLVPTSSEASTDVAFHLKLPPAGTHYFFAKAMLADSYGKTIAGSVSLSQKFSVEVASSVTLTVRTPAFVTVTLDGVPQSTRVLWGVSVGPHTVSIPDIVPVDDGTRLRFDRWTDGYTSSNRLVTLEDDAQFEAVYVKQFLLTATSPYGNATGTGWYDEGGTATFSVTASPQSMSGLYGLLGGKYVFSHWSGDTTANTPTASIKMDGPKTVAAVWTADYRTPIIAFATIIIFALMPLLYVFRKGKAAPTPPLRQPALPPAETVTQPPPEIRGETLLTSAIVSPLTSQRCSCGRNKEHLHYSSNHDFFVKWGLIFFLLAEGVSFIAGYVKVSTRVYLSYYQISAYDAVMSKTAELTAPYQYLSWMVDFVELAILILAIVAIATLHSIKNRATHLGVIVGVIVLFCIHYVTRTYYLHVTQQALSQLPNLFNADTLTTAQGVEEALYRECGFWCTPSSDVLNIVLSLADVGLFVAASLTSRVVIVWHPAVAAASAASAPARVPEPPPGAPITAPPIPTKFCRFCGAKILRESKYCEECGGRLI